MTGINITPQAYAFPEQLDERETEMLGTRVRTAMFDALACADKPYAAAGITFEQDGRFTKAKHSGHTVVSLIGQFSKGSLLQILRQNIADSAKDVAIGVLPLLQENLKLPSGHVLGFDVDASIYQVKQRCSRRLTAHVFQPPGDACLSRPTYYGEIQFDLYACQAAITLKDGEQWGGGSSVLSVPSLDLKADTYAELCDLICENFNAAVEELASRPGSAVH